MAVQVRYYSDPACPWSWAFEPIVRRLMVEFGADLRWTYVMGGLARDFTSGTESRGGTAGVYLWLVEHWMEVADESGMPFDPRLWTEGPIASSYPACMAAKAAAEQADDGGYRYLRGLREGLMCLRRKLDTVEALVEQARAARLDVARFRLDLASNAVVEALGDDLEEVREPPDEARAAGLVTAAAGRERLVFPSLVFVGEDGARHGVYGSNPYERCRDAALAAGATALGEPPPSPLNALRRFGRMATAEVEEVCALRGPRASAELWRLAAGWEVKPVRVLTGWLWELA